MGRRGSLDVGLVLVVGAVWAAAGTGFVAAVVPATREWLSVLWAVVLGVLVLVVAGWVVRHVVAEVLLDREIKAGNAEVRARLAGQRADKPVTTP